MADLAEEAYGVPVPWPDDTPEQYGADTVGRVIPEMAETCGLPIELANLECDEPPCIAALRILGPLDLGELTHCPAWADRYGAAMSGTSGMEIDCGDRTTENGMFLATPWTEFYDSLDAEERENWHKRFRARQNDLKKQWECAPAAPPR